MIGWDGIVEAALLRAFAATPGLLTPRWGTHGMSDVESMWAAAPLLAPGITGHEWASGWARAAKAASPPAREWLAQRLEECAPAYAKDACRLLRGSEWRCS